MIRRGGRVVTALCVCDQTAVALRSLTGVASCMALYQVYLLRAPDGEVLRVDMRLIVKTIRMPC